jgi:hypothetical protein
MGFSTTLFKLTKTITPRCIKILIRYFAHLGVEACRVIGQKTIRFGAPYGFYKLSTAVMHIIKSDQFCPPAPPDSLRARSGLGQDKHQPWAIFWTYLDNSRLVGPSLVVINAQKQILQNSAFYEHYKNDHSYKYFFLPSPVWLRGNWTSVISDYCRSGSYLNFSHWLLDGLPRLACLDQFPADTKILVPLSNNHSMNGIIQESLEMLNLWQRCRPTPEQHLNIEHYYFSSLTAMVSCHNPYAIHFLREKLLPLASTEIASPEKIYLVRNHPFRSILNNAEVTSFFQKSGWTAVNTDGLSLKEQIGLFSKAKAICSIHGAGLTHIIWAPPGCKVVELIPDNYLSGCYEAFAVSLGFEHHYSIFKADKRFCIHVDLPALFEILQELKLL